MIKRFREEFPNIPTFRFAIGSEAGWGSFDRRMHRWCRKRYGLEIGEFMWRGTMLNLTDLEGEEWAHYCEQVWNAIDKQDSNRA